MQRVVDMVHFVIAKTHAGKLGYIKLNRILWYSDLEHFRWHGVSMTGFKHYARTLQGPMSEDITRAVRQLVKAGKVEERTVKAANFARREMVSLDEPDVSALTEEQIGILKRMIAVIAPLRASRLTEITHSDSLWQEIANNEPMPIATASVVTRWPPPMRRPR